MSGNSNRFRSSFFPVPFPIWLLVAQPRPDFSNSCRRRVHFRPGGVCAVYMCATRCCGNNFFCSQTEIKHSMWIDKIIRLTGIFLPFSHSRIVCVCVHFFSCWCSLLLELLPRDIPHSVTNNFFLKANNAQELCFCSSLCVFVCNGIHALVLIIGRDTKKLQINKEEGKKAK